MKGRLHHSGSFILAEGEQSQEEDEPGALAKIHSASTFRESLVTVSGATQVKWSGAGERWTAALNPARRLGAAACQRMPPAPTRVHSQHVPQPVLLLQQLHGACKAGAAATDHKLPRCGQVDDSAARSAGVQPPGVKHQAAGGPQLLQGAVGTVLRRAQQGAGARNRMQACKSCQPQAASSEQPAISLARLPARRAPSLPGTRPPRRCSARQTRWPR